MSMPRYRWRRGALGLIAAGLLGGPAAAFAQPQPAPAAAPQYQPPPLLFVRIGGPAGMKATFFRGLAKGQTVATPAVVGLRPGYTYRIGIADMPDLPGRMFYPTLEVRASLYLGNRLRNAEFPAALKFSREDFARADAGALIRKVIVLENARSRRPTADPRRRSAGDSRPDGRNLFAAANDHGQPLVLVQMGQREYAAEELAFSGIPGTLLMPGEKVLAPPRQPPSGPWTCFPVVDPMAGPVDPRTVYLPSQRRRHRLGHRLRPRRQAPRHRAVRCGRRIHRQQGPAPARSVQPRLCHRAALRHRPRRDAARAQVGLAGLGRATVANGFDVVAGQQALVAERQRR